MVVVGVGNNGKIYCNVLKDKYSYPITCIGNVNSFIICLHKLGIINDCDHKNIF